MSSFPLKIALAASVLFAAAAGYALAQMPTDSPMGMHEQMRQGGMQGQMQGGMQGRMMDHMHQQMMQGAHAAMHGVESGAAGAPVMPGQDAFGAIQEIVQILQADPKTDWSKVNIEALRQHLIDMNEVTLHAAAAQRDLDNGIEIKVTGEGRTLEAIKRMVPAHANELRGLGWNASSDDLPNGVTLTIMTSETQPLTMLKALGFMGIMVQGGHHQVHHLMMATGQFAH